MAISDEAKACADSSPVGMFGFDDAMLLISVIELGFKLWQACSSSSSASDAVTAAGMAQANEMNKRRARRRLNHAARKSGVDPTTKDMGGLTAHMLSHVSKTSTDSLTACCSEPLIEDDTDE